MGSKESVHEVFYTTHMQKTSAQEKLFGGGRGVALNKPTSIRSHSTLTTFIFNFK